MPTGTTTDSDSDQENSFDAADPRIAGLLWDGPTAIVISDADDGTIRHVNDASVRLLGRNRSELIGKKADEARLWMDLESRTSIVEAAKAGQPHKGIQIDLRSADGRQLTIVATMSVVDLDGRPTLVSQLFDFTEQRQTEIRLRLLDRIARTGYETHSFEAVLQRSLEVILEALPEFRVGFASVVDGELIVSRSVGPDTPDFPSNPAYSITLFQNCASLLNFGAPIVINDIEADHRVETVRDQLQATGTAAILAVPVVRDGITAGIFYFHAHQPTNWTDHQVTLANDVAALLAISLFRARAEEELQRERELMQTVMDYAPDFLYVKDADLRFTRVNRALANFLGLDHPREAIGKTDFDFFPKGLATRYFADENRLLQSGLPIINMLEPLDERETSWTLSTKVPIAGEGGEILGFVGACRDVTSVPSLEVALRTTERRQRALLDAIPDIVFRFDHEGMFLDVRANREGELWVDPATRIGKHLSDVLESGAAENIMNSIDLALTEKRVVAVEYELDRFGRTHTFEMRLAPSSENEVVAISRDVTERKSLETKLAYQATHDPVTGLPNRMLFTERMQEALNLATADGASIAVLFIDLNNFKLVNDSFGHAAGDRLLTAIADRLRRCMRGGDTVARIGGDEFAILLDRVPSETEMNVIARRIADNIATPVRIGSHSVQTTASIGIAIGAPDQDTVESILDSADQAMYSAKRSGVPFQLSADSEPFVIINTSAPNGTNGTTPQFIAAPN